MALKLCTDPPVASILKESVLNVTNLCDHEAQQQQQLVAHITSQSCRKLNSIDVEQLESACNLVSPITAVFPLISQDQDEIC